MALTPVHSEGSDWNLSKLGLVLVTHGIANNFLSLGTCILSLYIHTATQITHPPRRKEPTSYPSASTDSACRFTHLTPAVSPTSTLLLATMRERLAVKVATVARAL